MDNPQKSNTTDGKPQMGLNRTNSEKKKLSRKMVSFGPKKELGKIRPIVIFSVQTIIDVADRYWWKIPTWSDRFSHLKCWWQDWLFLSPAIKHQHVIKMTVMPSRGWQWCWWHLYVGDFMMMFEIRCWWQNHYVGYFFVMLMIFLMY